MILLIDLIFTLSYQIHYKNVHFFLFNKKDILHKNVQSLYIILNIKSKVNISIFYKVQS